MEMKADKENSTRIATVGLIRIYGPKWSHYLNGADNNGDAFKAFDDANQEVVDLVRNHRPELEEKIAELLPQGFYVRIED